jgi:hypothetical protein
MRTSAAALLLALSACHGDTTTGIVVEVTSNLAVPAEAELHLRVTGPGGDLLRDVPFHASDLPARLSLVPQSTATTSVTVEAVAPGVTPQLRRRATVTFRRGSLLLLRLPLEAVCVCVPCADDQTCEGGRCVGVVKDAAQLPSYVPAVASPGPKVAVPACARDGAPPADDGGVPSGTDATAPDSAPPTHDAGANVPPGADAAPPPADAPPAPDGRRDAGPLPADAPILPPPPPPPPPDSGPPPPPDSAPPPDLPGLRAEGQPCGMNDQCLSGACVDHVCCHSACAGPCRACDKLDTGAPDGQCAPVLAGTDPDGDCAPDTPMSCGYDGTCNGAGACRLYSASTQCAAAACGADSTFTPARTCTGAGTCAPPAPQDCGLYLCAPGGCPGSCATDDACAPSAYCNGNTCVGQKTVGMSCGRPRECRTNMCPLGLCL